MPPRLLPRNVPPKPGRALPPQPVAAVGGMNQVNAATQKNQAMANGVMGNMMTLIKGRSRAAAANSQGLAVLDAQTRRQADAVDAWGARSRTLQRIGRANRLSHNPSSP